MMMSGKKLKLTHSQINADKESEGLKTSVKKFSGIAARHVRGKVTKQYRGLLTIYPVISGKALIKQIVIVKHLDFVLVFQN